MCTYYHKLEENHLVVPFQYKVLQKLFWNCHERSFFCNKIRQIKGCQQTLTNFFREIYFAKLHLYLFISWKQQVWFLLCSKWIFIYAGESQCWSCVPVSFEEQWRKWMEWRFWIWIQSRLQQWLGKWKWRLEQWRKMYQRQWMSWIIEVLLSI